MVTLEAHRHGGEEGWALDLTVFDPLDSKPWDFNKVQKRTRAETILRMERPWLLVLSPPCTMFSQLMHRNRWRMSREEWRRRWNEAIRHIRWCMRLCQIQQSLGGIYLYEQPWGAASWKDTTVIEQCASPGAICVKSHMCAHGMTIQGTPVFKPTGFLTNSVRLAQHLRKECSGDHAHISLMGGGKSKLAQEYPGQLCQAIIQGATAEREMRVRDCLVPIGAVDEESCTPYAGEYEPEGERNACNAHTFSEHASGGFQDSVTGKELDPRLVGEARKEELDYFRAHRVYEKVPRAVCWARTGRAPIRTRWVDVNKGDEHSPIYRSRLVAMEFKKGGSIAEYFSSTPPLEGLRFLFSDWASQNGGKWSHGCARHREQDQCLLIVDVRKAFLSAPVTRAVYVELPAEEVGPDDGETCVPD